MCAVDCEAFLPGSTYATYAGFDIQPGFGALGSARPTVDAEACLMDCLTNPALQVAGCQSAVLVTMFWPPTGTFVNTCYWKSATIAARIGNKPERFLAVGCEPPTSTGESPERCMRPRARESV